MIRKVEQLLAVFEGVIECARCDEGNGQVLDELDAIQAELRGIGRDRPLKVGGTYWKKASGEWEPLLEGGQSSVPVPPLEPASPWGPAVSEAGQAKQLTAHEE